MTRPDWLSTNVHIGAMVAGYRNQAGLTQKQIGDALGLSRTSVANIEAGRQPLDAHSLLVVADTLGVAVTDLLPGPGRPTVPIHNAAQRRAGSAAIAMAEAWIEFWDAVQNLGERPRVPPAQPEPEPTLPAPDTSWITMDIIEKSDSRSQDGEQHDQPTNP